MKSVEQIRRCNDAEQDAARLSETRARAGPATGHNLASPTVDHHHLLSDGKAYRNLDTNS